MTGPIGPKGSEHRSRPGETDSSPVDAGNLRQIFTSDQVRGRVDEIAVTVHRDFGDRPFLIVVIEKGGRRFASRMVQGVRDRGGRPEMLYIRARRTEGTRLAKPRLSLVEPKVFADRDVLVVDDVIDEGMTLDAVIGRVRLGGPKSIRTAVLVSKLEQRKVEIPLDYVGFELPSGWVVGYGMDLDGAYRDLDHLAVIGSSS